MVIDKLADKINVFHGLLVETRERFFVEGAWDSAFEEGGFEHSALLMGSGAKILGSSILIATPCHTLERIHTLRRDEVLYASNSLAFLLEASSTELDIGHIEYHTDLASILLGTRRCTKSMPTAGKERIEIHYHCNLLIDSDLNLQSQAKIKPPDFVDFNDYKQYCLRALQSLFRNAGSDLRKAKYSPLATISSGYDSACGAALAKAAGCGRAVTIRSLSPDGNSDNGRPIADALGYSHIHEYEYDEYKRIDALSEVEAFASGDLVLNRFNTFESDCVQSVLISGINGDVVWDRNNGHVADLRRKESNLGGLSAGIAEFRLRAAFIHVPLPFFGASRHDSIFRISNSAEMQKWMIGGGYDRPIPRRILEEMGVPRRLFGIRKQGIGIGVSYFPKRMNAESHAALLRFSKRHRSKRPCLKQALFWVAYLAYLTPKVINSCSERWGTTWLRVPQFVPFKYARNPGLASYMIPWGVSVLRDRYRIAGAYREPLKRSDLPS